jgi:hypothetical protein
MHPFLAIRAFFAVLFGRVAGTRIRECLDNKPAQIAAPTTNEKTVESAKLPKPLIVSKAKPAMRNEALTLLSALQREARLIDLICESLDQYNDAQVGAAARDVLRDSKKTLERMFGLKPLVEATEGSSVSIPNDPSPLRWRIIGKDSAQQGTLSHPGWQATRLDMPQWSGSAEDALIIAAAEVES